MGICGYFNEMDTKVPEEEFIRQIISSFKAREFKIDFLAEQFLSAPIEERMDFYQNFVVETDKALNNYAQFHLDIINKITNCSTLYDNDQFTILKIITFAFPDNQKILFLRKHFNIKTLNSLIEICKIIWNINLILINQICYDLSKSEDNLLTGKIGELIDKVYTDINLSNFQKDIFFQWRNWLIKEDENDLDKSNDFWEVLQTKFDYCFNAVELRHYFFVKYYNED